MSQSNHISTSTAQLSCLCGAIKESGSLLASPTGTFPLSSEICHCNPCRQSTGNLCISSPPLKSKPSGISLSKLTAYASSKKLVRYFCSTCGSHSFIHTLDGLHGKDYWCVYAGMIQRDPDQVQQGEKWCRDIVKTRSHDWIADTLDGGIVPSLFTINDIDIPLYLENGASNSPVSQEEVLALQTKSDHKRPDLLHAKCHCGAIDLSITTARYDSDTQGVPEDHIPTDRSKYIAYFCACQSCRLGSGAFAFQPWCYIPPSNVTFTGSGISTAEYFDASNQTKEVMKLRSESKMKIYNSSIDVQRTFCGTCGATVFYWADDRLEMIDLAVGILRAEEGAMARQWLAWRFEKDVFDVEATEKGILEAMLAQVL